MRICIVAENASTRFGGEAIIPVHYFRLLRSRKVQTWMVVHARTRSEVEQLFPDDLDHIAFVPDLWIHKVIFYLSRFLPRRVSESTLGLLNQLITQFFQRKIVRRLVREQGIDVVHQPTPVAPRFPSLIFGLGAPVVIGPLNGGMEYPPAFRNTESRMSRAFVALGRFFSNGVHALFPGKRRASVVLVANERTRKSLPSEIRGKIIELVENGIDVRLWHNTPSAACVIPGQFVFIGRLVDWKAVDVVIKALKRVPAAQLEIIGEGPMAEEWKALVAEMGLKDRVQFTGWLSQSECAVRLQFAVALVLPSVYECGGAVVLESMAMGKPVIATHWGGPADYLDSSCGILLEPKSYADLVTGFADAMQRLIDSPDLARAMGAAGMSRVSHSFDWELKIDRVIGIYRALIERPESILKFDERASVTVPVSKP
jgi:glycosyltransferase involved in cell wall biosynthesis